MSREGGRHASFLVHCIPEYCLVDGVLLPCMRQGRGWRPNPPLRRADGEETCQTRRAEVLKQAPAFMALRDGKSETKRCAWR